MWVPYVLVCNENDVWRIILEAEQEWFVAWRIWSIREKWEEDYTTSLTWLWVWDSQINI